ncbi:MAG: TetR/AcrR family transcriptional regulator [Spirochaetia bacterium]
MNILELKEKDFPNFHGLNTDKKERILQAALAEFTDHGFEAASTNRIAKDAGIGKGMLFHYFRSKELLFCFCVHYAMADYGQYYERNFKNLSGDIFERGLQWIELKTRYYQESSEYALFLTNAYYSSQGQIRAAIEQAVSLEYSQRIQDFTQGVDFSGFRPDIDVKKAVDIYFMTIQGIGERFVRTYWKKEAPLPVALLRQEVEEYSRILEKGFYK